MDVKRGLNIRLNNGPSISTLGEEKARDAYVDFLTDGMVKSYAEADEKTKIKACLLMNFTTQGFAATAIKAVGNAFDGKGINSRLSPGRGNGKRVDDFHITKDEKGCITIQAKVAFTSPVVIVADQNNVSYPRIGNEGSGFAYDLKVTVSEESLDRFAGADWENFNNKEITAIEGDTTRQYNVKAAADALPDGTKLDLDADVSFNINVDSLT